MGVGKEERDPSPLDVVGSRTDLCGGEGRQAGGQIKEVSRWAERGWGLRWAGGGGQGGRADQGRGRATLLLSCLHLDYLAWSQGHFPVLYSANTHVSW